jgi:hypothetical protein
MPKAAAACLCLALLLLAGCAPPRPAAKPRTRAELKEALHHKTREQVLELIGRPDHTSGISGELFERWEYRNRNLSYDPVSGKTDRRLSLMFDSEGTTWGVKMGR